MRRRNSFRAGRSVWPFVGFLALFSILLTVVSKWYLLPALDAYNHADLRERKVLGVHALLLMTLLLIILGLCLVMMFRISRYFFPRPYRKPEKTQYTDAWAEAGKRLKTPKK